MKSVIRLLSPRTLLILYPIPLLPHHFTYKARDARRWEEEEEGNNRIFTDFTYFTDLAASNLSSTGKSDRP